MSLGIKIELKLLRTRELLTIVLKKSIWDCCLVDSQENNDKIINYLAKSNVWPNFGDLRHNSTTADDFTEVTNGSSNTYSEMPSLFDTLCLLEIAL